ncbi:ALP1-like protein [Tanacetum coccineum]
MGKAPEVLFVANDVTYPWGYYLCDGIYPKWVPFVKSVTNLADDDHKRLRYKTMHEATRKDVERAFGVLKKKWAILATPARAYIKEKLENIMYACIILHNMIIKDSKEAISSEWYPEEEHQPDDLIRSDEQRYRIIRTIFAGVASQDLWIWHAFFGVSGANNDINVTQRSPLLNDLKMGKAPEVPFVANDVTYPWGYYLCDGIYPEWVPFVKSVTNLADDDHKRLRYKAMHEAARKDVEQAFGVLKKKWAILATPARAYIKEKLANIMYTCIILHNMIIKDSKEAISSEWYPEEEHQPDDLIRSDEQRYRIKIGLPIICD